MYLKLCKKIIPILAGFLAFWGSSSAGHHKLADSSICKELLDDTETYFLQRCSARHWRADIFQALWFTVSMEKPSSLTWCFRLQFAGFPSSVPQFSSCLFFFPPFLMKVTLLTSTTLRTAWTIFTMWQKGSPLEHRPWNNSKQVLASDI